MKEQIVNELIKYFLEEDNRPNIEIPKIYANKRTLLNGLINMRKPKVLDEKILEKEDELLKEELEEKDLLDVNLLEEKISVVRKDITSVKCDAIVNPCDNNILGCFIPNHKCVQNLIHTYSGIRLRLKINEITKGKNIAPGKVILTEGYNLPSKKIVHTVCPTILDNLKKEDIDNLKSCYINSLELAKNNDIKTIAFPCAFTDNNNFPKDLVTKIAIETVMNYLKEDDYFEKVIFCPSTLEENTLYEKYLKNF